MSCCKEKAVLVAVYEEKPRKRGSTRNKVNIKHHHYHHHHHHLHVHRLKDDVTTGGNINRRAQLLSYSKHLRDSSKLKASDKSPQHHPNSLLVASSTNTQQTSTDPVVHVQTKHKLKKQSSWVDMKNLFKCFAVSHAKRRVKKNINKKKKKNTESSAKKASVMMKTFNARTQKGARRFFKKLMATIQKYR